MLLARTRIMTKENRIKSRLRFEPVGAVRTESRDVDWMCYQYMSLRTECVFIAVRRLTSNYIENIIKHGINNNHDDNKNNKIYDI